MTFRQGTEEYYKNFIELQEKLRKSEEERLKLEMKFNEMIQVTQEEEHQYYRKLRSQYKRFLDENYRRQERNERILRLLERVESRAAVLEAKTQRFKSLRRQYQAYLRRCEAPKSFGIKEEKKSHDDEDVLQRYLRGLNTDEHLRSRMVNRRADVSSIADEIMKSIHTKRKTGDEGIGIFKRDGETKDFDEHGESLLGIGSRRRCPSRVFEAESSDGFATSDFEGEDNKGFKARFSKLDDQLNQNSYGRSEKPTDFAQNDRYFEETGATSYDSHEKSQVEYVQPEGTVRLEELNEILNFESKDEKTKASVRFNVDSPDGIKDEKGDGEKFLLKTGKTVSNHSDRTEIEEQSLNTTNAPNMRNNFEVGSTEQILQNNEANSERTKRETTENDVATEKSVKQLNQINDGGKSILIGDLPPTIQHDENDKTIKFDYQPLECKENEQLNRYDENEQPIQHDQIHTDKVIQPIQSDENDKPLCDKSENKIQSNNNGQSIQSNKNIGETNGQNNDLQPIKNTEMQYDKNGQPIRYDGEIIQYTDIQHDENGQPNGNQLIQYDEGQPIENQSVECDENSQPIAEKPTQYDENGQPIHYDEQGQPIQYDLNGHPIGYGKNGLSDAYNTDGKYDQKEFVSSSYDANGQPLQYDTEGQVIQYDENGQPVNYDANGQPINYDENGQPINYDENGQTINYDANGQKINYDANGQPINYDENGQPINYDANAQPINYDENGQPINYDENGQPINYDENGQPINYDASGQPINYDASGQPINYDENGQPINYDANGQNINYDANGQPINYDASGQPINYDENGQPINYDASGQPINYDENGQPINYDENGQPINYDENGQPINYDENGQPINYDENGQPTNYDENGQPINYDENGQPINYDANGQPINYDENGQPIQYDEYGQPIDYQNIQYDENGQPINIDLETRDETETSAQESSVLTFENDGDEQKKPNVLELLETDTESTRQDANKVSNDSDFDFSNNA